MAITAPQNQSAIDTDRRIDTSCWGKNDMQTERVFNIFVYFDHGTAVEYGVRFHKIGGDERTKLNYLRTKIALDCKVARRFRLSRQFAAEEWRAQLRLGNSLAHFEEAFVELRAQTTPIVCVTPVVDGFPTVDQQIDIGPFRGPVVSEQRGLGSVPDYLVNYTDSGSFRFTDLIHDDYFKAIRTLFNETLYVSCAKLLMSCVDTLAFVEFGDEPRNFTRWVDTYVDLSQLGITSIELWEFRNSVLHMTNLASRKVLSGKISPIMPVVGPQDRIPPAATGIPKPFSLFGLIEAIAAGIGRWGASHNADREKMLKFIERYDTTISDSRLAWIRFDSSPADRP